jgi:hypothetical protein
MDALVEKLSPAGRRAEVNSPWDTILPKVDAARAKGEFKISLTQDEYSSLRNIPQQGKIEITPESDWKDAPTGLKYDTGKPPISLVDPEFIEGVASVLAFGANKYAADNWRGGIAYRRLIDAAYRHLGAINRGEDVDTESNLPHIHHLGCCVMFLSWMMNHRQDLDDRYKY